MTVYPFFSHPNALWSKLGQGYHLNKFCRVLDPDIPSQVSKSLVQEILLQYFIIYVCGERLSHVTRAIHTISRSSCLNIRHMAIALDQAFQEEDL